MLRQAQHDIDKLSMTLTNSAYKRIAGRRRGLYSWLLVHLKKQLEPLLTAAATSFPRRKEAKGGRLFCGETIQGHFATIKGSWYTAVRALLTGTAPLAPSCAKRALCPVPDV
ncbi:hypothetical protein C7T94_10655 [Pedobacter yulinensis]|uniref:Uncharacterized protein n=1 Tax=Pedobacter yulinensis TaxID=2126353 RepID=A0A2T3HKW4_9SPHI|nr:hypothetical protein C7T94_10655 [Pedobacter yulinensis]